MKVLLKFVQSEFSVCYSRGVSALEYVIERFYGGLAAWAVALSFCLWIE